MGVFTAIDIAATGADLSQMWIDVLAHNLANVDTARPPDEEPFRAKLVWAQEITGGRGAAGSGVALVGLPEDQTEARMVYDPGHPFADEDGNVRLPAVDVAGQMSDLIIAQRSYQLSLRVIENSREVYEAALRIGRS